MAEVLVEKGICEACGAGIREGSAFCFSCGESVIVEPPPPAILKPDPRTLNGGDARAARTVEFSEPEPPPVMVPTERLEHVSAVPNKTQSPEPAKDLRTAAAVRREAGPRKVKTVEVEWVERPPSILRFLIVSFIFALLTAGLIVAAYYLR
jgi:hypothetical protein